MTDEEKRQKRSEYWRRYMEQNKTKLRERRRRYYERHKAELRERHQQSYRLRQAANWRDGLKLRAYRDKLGLKQREVAALAGVDLSKISQWETGASKIDPERIRQIPGFEGFTL